MVREGKDEQEIRCDCKSVLTRSGSSICHALREQDRGFDYYLVYNRFAPVPFTACESPTAFSATPGPVVSDYITSSRFCDCQPVWLCYQLIVAGVLSGRLQVLHLTGNSVEPSFAPLAEIESFGSSFVYGRNPGWPGMYLRRTSGTVMPFSV